MNQARLVFIRALKSVHVHCPELFGRECTVTTREGSASHIWPRARTRALPVPVDQAYPWPGSGLAWLDTDGRLLKAQV
jgi:hypothetical protein